MFKKIIFTVSFVLLSLYGMAQKDINSYKYVLVPKTFEFSKNKDQYQLNSLLKFLFNKYGYEAYFTNDKLPDDLIYNRCLALTADVEKAKGGLFKTKLEVILTDCFGNKVLTSKTGESREKDYQKAYTEALRNAFETYQNLDYQYVPSQDMVIVSSDNKTKSAKQTTTEIQQTTNKVAPITKDFEANTVAAKVEKSEIKTAKTKHNLSDLHYAQDIENGFQLVNSEPRIVMVLLNTAAENVFLVKGKSAIVFKENGSWYYSENDGKLGEKKSLNIKF
ncbi:hypothetical protein [Winogradskyella bathintestinalis]|uniref:SH3 domain-containing protein n=1 Tax=Winogradskyella bathintestinalis TaxID=3035208 RepID=A0ABT7ZUM8_9FLAO|nr:hypothetical protein [Winogradskyella bathintestinalis]MDN3492682.1 hypothetical protein [Winogradskyella bathintestinalis]